MHTDGSIGIITCSRTCPLARWGLRCCRLDQDQPAFLWLPKYNRQVLTLESEAAGSAEDAFDFLHCPLLKTAVRVGEQELHLLFGDGPRTLQVIARGNPIPENPVLLQCTLRGMAEFKTKPMTLRRLYCLYRRGRLAKSLYPDPEESDRWIDVLRAWDGLQAGASYREIGEVVYGKREASEDWHSGYRYRVLRLIKRAYRMAGGAYLTLMRGRDEKKKRVEPGET